MCIDSRSGLRHVQLREHYTAPELYSRTNAVPGTSYFRPPQPRPRQ